MHSTEQNGPAVTLYSCIRDALRSNIGETQVMLRFFVSPSIQFPRYYPDYGVIVSSEILFQLIMLQSYHH
jgi:hypothetical protein